MLFHLAHPHLRQNLVVDGGEFRAVGLVVAEVIDIHLRRVLDGDLVGIELVAHQLKTVDVVVAVGNLAEGLGGGIAGEDFVHAAVVHHAQNLLVIFRPADTGEVVVEISGHVGALVGGKVEHHQAQLVAFVAVAFHALPSDEFSAVAEDGVLVVTLDVLAEVAGGAFLNDIQEDVAVGGMGVVGAGFLAAGVGDGLAVGAVVVLLHAAPRAHRALKGAVDKAGGIIDIYLLAVEVGKENLRVLVHPAVPMAVHQVLVDAAGGFVEAVEQFVDVVGPDYLFSGDENDGLAVGGQFEAFDSVFNGGYGFLAFAFHIHGDDVVAAAEKQGIVILPHGVEFAGGGGGETHGLAALGGHQVEFRVALVLFHTVVGEGVGQLFPVRGDGGFAHLA